jgi:hypothetical protein
MYLTPSLEFWEGFEQVGDPVGKHPKKTLADHFTLHGEERRNSSEEVYVHNMAPDRGMKKARRTLLWSMRMSSLIESVEKKPEVKALSLVEELFIKVRNTRNR